MCNKKAIVILSKPNTCMVIDSSDPCQRTRHVIHLDSVTGGSGNDSRVHTPTATVICFSLLSK